MSFLAATNNPHKLEELAALLQPFGVTVVRPAAVGGIPEVEETGSTFTENAVLKARAVASSSGCLAFADDSGLEVQALGGEPGIRSARYAGPGASDRDKMAKLLRRLDDHDDRRARFVCVVAVASPQGLIGTATGEVRGRIAEAPRGDGGFGYDPVFVPEGYNRTLGELEPDVKARISHRANAIAAAVRAGLFSEVHGERGDH